VPFMSTLHTASMPTLVKLQPDTYSAMPLLTHTGTYKASAETHYYSTTHVADESCGMACTG